MILEHMQVLLNLLLATNPHKLRTKKHKQTIPLQIMRNKHSQKKTPKETPKGKQEKRTPSPGTGPALKPATLEMMKNKEERKNEDLDRIKQQQKEESNTNIRKINRKKN